MLFVYGDITYYHLTKTKFNILQSTFTKDGVYQQVGLEINGKEAYDLFGYSVSISADGTTFVAGAKHVRVFKYNPTIDRYVQIGLDMDGEAARNQFGSSVSISADGCTFVVGATRNDDNAGHVRVYKYNSTLVRYLQVGLDIDSEAAGDWFGNSVSISADGTTFVAGAIYNDGNGSNSGHVRVYKYNSTINRYVQFGMDIDGEATYDLFGSSVSISADGTTFVVGAVGNDDNVENMGGGFPNDDIVINDDRGYDNFDSGHVRVYKYNCTARRYIQLGLDIDGEAKGDNFGGSVSISADGSTFVVGAQYNDGNGIYSGHVRAYEYNSTIKSYSQVGVDINGEAAYDNLGYSVALSADGTTFAVGAFQNDNGSGGDSGHVRVYKYNSTIKRYTQIGSDIDGGAAGDWLGFSVSISADGTIFAVGAVGNDDNGSQSGHVRVYRDSTKTPKSAPSKVPMKSSTKVPRKAPVPVSFPVKLPNNVPVKVPTKCRPTKVPLPVLAPIVATPSVPVPARVPLKVPRKAPVPVSFPVKLPNNVPVKVPTKCRPTKVPLPVLAPIVATPSVPVPARVPMKVPMKSSTKVPRKASVPVPTKVQVKVSEKRPSKALRQ